jgi:hypothetical protein
LSSTEKIIKLTVLTRPLTFGESLQKLWIDDNESGWESFFKVEEKAQGEKHEEEGGL